jgi:uncharacterized membrane protein
MVYSSFSFVGFYSSFFFLVLAFLGGLHGRGDKRAGGVLISLVVFLIALQHFLGRLIFLFLGNKSGWSFD